MGDFESQRSFARAVMTLLPVFGLLLLGGYILLGIALSLFFRKVGVQPGTAWIPVYNTWKWLEVGGLNGAWSLLVFVPGGFVVTWVMLCIGMRRTGVAFARTKRTLLLGILLPVIWLFVVGSRGRMYRPELIAARGYPPPRAGHIAVRQTVPRTTPFAS